MKIKSNGSITPNPFSIQQYNNNVDIKCFEIPRFYYGNTDSETDISDLYNTNPVDLSTCNVIVRVTDPDDMIMQGNELYISTKTGEDEFDDDDDIVVVNWVITDNISQYAGKRTYQLEFYHDEKLVFRTQVMNFVVKQSLDTEKNIIEKEPNLIKDFQDELTEIMGSAKDYSEYIDKTIEAEMNEKINYYHKYTSSYKTKIENESEIPININAYNSATLLFVFVNGIIKKEETDYIIDGSNVIFKNGFNEIGTEIYFVCLKSMTTDIKDYDLFKGEDGVDGLGVPAGGETWQVLAKKSDTDNDTEWVDQIGVIRTSSGTSLKIEDYQGLNKFTKEGKSTQDGTPTPENPSEIISIPSVENLCKLEYTKLLTNASGTIITNDTAYTTIIDTNDLDYLTISGDFSLVGDNIVRIGLFNEFPEVGVSGLKLNANSTKTIDTINYKYVLFSFVNMSDSYDVVEKSFQIEKGKIAHPWRPYGNYLRIDNVGKNLFGLTTWINAYLDNTGVLHNGVSTNCLFEDYIEVKSDTKYSLSCNTNLRNIAISEFDSSKSFIVIKMTNNTKINSFTTNSTTKYIRVQFNYDNSTAITDDIVNNLDIMLEKGSQATEYEPYRNKVIFVNMEDKKLCSIGDIKDELIIYDNGKTEIDKRIEEIVLTGNENWQKESLTYGNNFYIKISDAKGGTDIPILSNYFLYNGKLIENYSIIISSTKNLNIRYSEMNTVQEFKNFLISQYNAGTPVKVQYELAEPQTIDLGITDFNLLDGNSELTCEDESNMQLKYLVISNDIFVQDSLDGNSTKKAPSVRAVNEINNLVYKKDNYAILEGTITIPANTGTASTSVDYPNGFTINNCVIISLMAGRTSKIKATPIFMDTSLPESIGARDLFGKMTENNIVIQASVSTALSSEYTTYFKVVLFKYKD